MKRGRPLGSGANEVQIGIRLPRVLRDRLRTKARAGRITLSQLIRHLLDGAVGTGSSLPDSSSR